jgi:hypothetical protein
VKADTTDVEQALFARLDTLASDMSNSRLEFGHVALDLYRVVFEDFMEQAGGKQKKALTKFINLVHERESKEIDARKTVVEAIRIAKFVPRKSYELIVKNSDGYRPTFHQIRAIVFTLTNGELDEAKSGAMIDWCVENKWPPVADIRAHREVIDPKPESGVDPKEKLFGSFVKMSQHVMEQFTEGGEEYNCAKNVLETWKKINHLGSA